MHCSRCLLLLAFAFSIFAAAAADLLSAEERWRYLQGGQDAGGYLRFLREHPDSVYVPQARAYLEARDKEPLGRLVEPDQTCRALVQARAQEFLKQAPASEHKDRYSLVLPQDHFLTAPTYVEAPRGQTLAQAPIEHRLTIHLIAGRDGGCTIHQRWGYGSGLGQACRCVPVDPQYRFRSMLADGILSDVARMRAGVAVCGDDHADAIDAFLREVITAKRERADRLRAHKAAGKVLYPTEQQELEDIDYAMPQLLAGLPPPLVQDQEHTRLQALLIEHRTAFCGHGLADGIASARRRIAEMTPTLP